MKGDAGEKKKKEAGAIVPSVSREGTYYLASWPLRCDDAFGFWFGGCDLKEGHACGGTSTEMN